MSKRPRTQRFDWLARRSRSHSTSQHDRRLRIEPLEDRRLLSAGDLDPTFGVGGKVLTDFGAHEYGRDVAVLRVEDVGVLRHGSRSPAFLVV